MRVYLILNNWHLICNIMLSSSSIFVSMPGWYQAGQHAVWQPLYCSTGNQGHKLLGTGTVYKIGLTLNMSLSPSTSHLSTASCLATSDVLLLFHTLQNICKTTDWHFMLPVKLMKVNPLLQVFKFTRKFSSD